MIEAMTVARDPSAISLVSHRTRATVPKIVMTAP